MKQDNMVDVEVRLDKQMALHFAKVAADAGVPVETVLIVALALGINARKGAPEKSDAVVSVDGDGIITAHRKAAVWPYDHEGTTAVQVDTPYGYVLVRVQRYDRPEGKTDEAQQHQQDGTSRDAQPHAQPAPARKRRATRPAEVAPRAVPRRPHGVRRQP